jgi:hypothetical protein
LERKHQQHLHRRDLRVGPAALMSGPMAVKRKAVPPGYLHDLLHARHRMNSLGIRLGPDGHLPPPRPLADLPAPGPSAAPAPALRTAHQRAPYVPAKTLPLFFEQRKRYLQQKKLCGATPYQQRVGEPVGLLSLPEDVMVSPSPCPGAYAYAYSACGPK